MTNRKKTIIYLSALTLCLAGCESIVNSIIMPKQAERELRRNHQDPSLMLKEMEHEHAIKNSQDIERQKMKDDEAINRKLNEVIDKSLGR